jgi:aminoglycoside 3-N-acetyltransferase
MITCETIARDLCAIGICARDVLYVRAQILRTTYALARENVGATGVVGQVASSAAKTVLKGFIRALGSEGTLVVPTFTNVSTRWSKERYTFSRSSPTNCGAFSHAVLNHPEGRRSTHPTHSFAAIGPLAQEILGDHDETKTPFHPIRKLIGLDAKMLLVGCNKESPGFSTTHYVQSELGLSSKHWTRYLYDVSYEKDGRNVKWTPSEDPGCSMGFDKLYPSYIRAENFITGDVGGAYSILVRARNAYEVDRDVLARNPLAVLCDRADCVSCRILRGYNLMAIPGAVLKRIGSRSLSMLARQNARVKNLHP